MRYAPGSTRLGTPYCRCNLNGRRLPRLLSSQPLQYSSADIAGPTGSENRKDCEVKDAFNGTWTIDTAESWVWDDNLKKHVADEMGEEVITLRIEDGVQD